MKCYIYRIIVKYYAFTMGFKKGKEWKGNKFGRPKGSQNRSTEQMKLNISRALNGTLDYLKEDLEKIREKDPAEAIKLATKLLDYTLPKMKSVEVKGEIEQKIEQIVVNIKRSGSEEDRREQTQ